MFLQDRRSGLVALLNVAKLNPNTFPGAPRPARRVGPSFLLSLMVQERFPGPFATPYPEDAITSLNFHPMPFTVGRFPFVQDAPLPPSSSSGQLHLGLS